METEHTVPVKYQVEHINDQWLKWDVAHQKGGGITTFFFKKQMKTGIKKGGKEERKKITIFSSVSFITPNCFNQFQ